MDWSSERWVKLYTRKTPSWNVLPWQSRALLPLLLKECDRSGQIELGRAGVAGLAACVGLPIEVAAPGLAGLIEDGSVTVGNAVLTVEKYVEAQESATSNAERQRRFKDRQKHLKSPDMQVTGGNGRKRAVTIRVEENRVEENREDQLPCEAVASPPAPADLVWAHWRDTLHPTARVFDTATRKKVEARLAEGFTVDDLRRAIDGCKSNPHNMGANDRGKRYDSLELICRDGAKVTQFRGYLDAPTARGPTKPGFQQITAKDPLDFMHPNIRGKYCDLPIEEARARWLRDGGDTQARSIDDHGTGLRNPGG